MDSPLFPLKPSIPEPTPPITRDASRDASPAPPRQIEGHAKNTYQEWVKIGSLTGNALESVKLDGDSLDIASIVAVAKYGSKPRLDTSQRVLAKINDSVTMLDEHLKRGDLVYGVNTGFGGSADTRTSDLPSLQRALVQHQNSAVLAPIDMARPEQKNINFATGDIDSHAMPKAWTKGLMLTRVNSVVRGHSAVSLPVIEAILAFLRHDLTPVIPLRGSISASGDLIPLSYVAGALQGNPDIYVRTGSAHDHRVVTAPEALKLAGLQPITLAAKEGLGLLNGTAASASVGSLALHETNHLALMAQLLTAMGCEALRGTAESFHPFIASVRPHRGQVESAASILGFLSGSRLAKGVLTPKHVTMSGLCQDRYALRTASQWIGPQLEDLMLANEQLTVELNSTTDNPLIDAANGIVHHGGNFQAASVTSAMEKTRVSISMLGKMLFAQATEIVNPQLNRGLPPNLSADDPSLSFTCKGLDISLAAYYSELAFLANPVSTHVQSAEMHNQAINSLALISARYTLQAVEIASLMCASYLFLVCQALDLRVLQILFLEGVRDKIAEMTRDLLTKLSGDEMTIQACQEVMWNKLVAEWEAHPNTSLDLNVRCEKTAEAMAGVLMTQISTMESLEASAKDLFSVLDKCKQALPSILSTTYNTTRSHLFQNHATITPTYLGQASSKMYSFIRRELNVPFHRGLVDDPTQDRTKKSIGSLVGIIYEAIRDGRAHEPVMSAVNQNMSRA